MADNKDGDEYMISNEEDHDAILSDTEESTRQYFDMLAMDEQKALNNVIPFRQPEARHTDTELVETTQGEMIFQRFSFSAEQALLAAADRQWLIDGMIPSGGFGALYGKPGSYKSFVALDMAACISTGRSWHGIDCDSPGLVIYVAAEGSYGLEQRKRAWEIHHGEDLTDRVVVLPMAIMLNDLLTAQALIEAVRLAEQKTGKPIRMIVIDTFARTFNGDENSVKETGVWINASGRVSEDLSGCTVLMVTHTTKAENGGIRGSSALAGACDFIYEVRRPPKADMQVVVRNTKQKDIDEAEDMLFALDKVPIGHHDKKGREITNLILMLEAKGSEISDEESDEPVLARHDNAMEAADMNHIVNMVKAGIASGKPVTEAQCRKDVIASIMDSGIAYGTAYKKWGAAYRKATEAFGLIYKKGAHLYLSKQERF